MCGIAGVFGLNESGTNIIELIDAIKHRGPDGKGFWEQGNIALGHARLSIIDLTEDGIQPMLDPDTGNRIVFNGEIYNYLEIKEKLKSVYHFRTETDTEVILAAYKVFGINFFKELRGMFAFALFDEKLQKILLARDRFGIKPLYYTKFRQALFIASEIKGLLCINGFERRVNELKAYEFLANRQLDCDGETMFSNIYQLLPAQYTWVSALGEMDEPQTYWELPEPGKKIFDTNAEDELVSVFEETVKLHLRADVPVASFLSGGLDSTSVACFAAKNMNGKTLPVFSAILPYSHPENSLIKTVLEEKKQFIPRQFLLDGSNFFNEIPNVIYHHDEPIMDGSMYAHYKLCQLAGADGIKVLLSGSGGDELFGGYASHLHSYHAKLIGQFRFGKYLREIKESSSNSHWPVKELLFKSIYECFPFSMRRSIKNIQIKKNNPQLTIHPPIKHFYHTQGDAYFANMVNNYKSWTAPPYLHYEDRNAMAFGVEIRVPFYDHKLVEHVLQYGHDQIIKGSTKSMMRNSFSGIVPDAVLKQKGKYGFPSPIDGALKDNAEGKNIFHQFYQQTPFLNAAITKRIAENFYSGNGDLNTYWRILSFIIWYQIFFNKKNPFT